MYDLYLLTLSAWIRRLLRLCMISYMISYMISCNLWYHTSCMSLWYHMISLGVKWCEDIPVQPPVVVPVRTIQEVVSARDLPLLNADAANVFSQSRTHPAGPRPSTRYVVGSRLYEVNIWMWHCCQGRPRTVSLAEADRIRAERLSESRIRAAETRKRRSEAAAAAGAAEGGGGADWTLAYNSIVHIIVDIITDIIYMIWTMISKSC